VIRLILNKAKIRWSIPSTITTYFCRLPMWTPWIEQHLRRLLMGPKPCCSLIPSNKACWVLFSTLSSSSNSSSFSWWQWSTLQNYCPQKITYTTWIIVSLYKRALNYVQWPRFNNWYVHYDIFFNSSMPCHTRMIAGVEMRLETWLWERLQQNFIS